MRLRLWAILLAVPLAGCSLITEPEPRVIAGETDGYAPGQSTLKLAVRDEGSGKIVWAVFERRDWHVARIASDVDHGRLDDIAFEGVPRTIMTEYAVARIVTPDALQAYRYDAMKATAQEREAMDAEYSTLLVRLANGEHSPEGGGRPMISTPSVLEMDQPI